MTAGKDGKKKKCENLRNLRLGEKKMMECGVEAEIIEYIDAEDIEGKPAIKFTEEDGYVYTFEYPADDTDFYLFNEGCYYTLYHDAKTGVIIINIIGLM